LLVMVAVLDLREDTQQQRRIRVLRATR